MLQYVEEGSSPQDPEKPGFRALAMSQTKQFLERRDDRRSPIYSRISTTLRSAPDSSARIIRGRILTRFFVELLNAEGREAERNRAVARDASGAAA
jgi:hypothetical protein